MVRQKRAGGEGAIFYDASKKRWVARVETGLDSRGHRRRTSVQGRTRTEVAAKLKELHSIRDAHVDLSTRSTTFAEATTLWLARGLSNSLSENTKHNYTRLLRVHILPVLGPMKLLDIRPDDVELALDKMAVKGRSASTMRQALNLTRRVLKFAERRGLVVRNAASLVETPDGPTATRAGLTPEEAQALLRAARTSRLGNLFRISLLLGLRPGEAAALRWPALHLDDDVPTVDIVASLQRLNKTMRLTKPKTPTSVRTLGLPRAAVSAFREQKELQELERGASSNLNFNPLQLVFANEQGEPLDPSNVRRALASVAKRAGIGHVHPHLLRHAAASLMSAAGMRLEDISDTLGHRSVMVTAEIYRHPIAPVRVAHVGAIEQMLEKQNKD